MKTVEDFLKTIDNICREYGPVEYGIPLENRKVMEKLKSELESYADQFSQSQNSQDKQFINRLQSELHWERDVVVPDLEQKLDCALTAIYDLASMLNK